MSASGPYPVARDALHPPEVSRIDGATHYEVGVAYEELQLPDEAVYEFELAADDPEWAFSSWRSVGRVHHSRERWDEARVAYVRALEVVGRDAAEARDVSAALDLVAHRTPLPPKAACDDGIEVLDPDDLELIEDVEPVDVVKDEVDAAFDDLFR